MAIYFDNSNITTGSRGPEGPQGIQGPIGPNEVSSTTTTNISGILKGNGSTVQTAIAGTDYATVEQTKTFIVTFTLGENETITADKTAAEIHAALDAKRNVIGLLSSTPYVFTPAMDSHYEEEGAAYDTIYFSCVFGDSNILVYIISDGTIGFDIVELQTPPDEASSLPASGAALTADTIYNVSSPVGTYAFTPPDTGWAHGKFTTGSSVSVSFSGTFMGAAPTIEASKAYEFDVFDGVWVVQEVVSA